MVSDLDFATRADRFMAEMLEALGDIDPDEVDADLAMGVLSLEFSDGSRCIMNRQSAAQQIWLAHGATAWHFAFDAASDRWLDTKGRGELRAILAQEISGRLGRKITLATS